MSDKCPDVEAIYLAPLKTFPQIMIMPGRNGGTMFAVMHENDGDLYTIDVPASLVGALGKALTDISARQVGDAVAD